ncbi:UvrD-helicase domain-containing protein [Thermosulfuriphilus sp.]
MSLELPSPHVLKIKASAGAGKTYQLTRHYLRLLKGLGRPSPEALRSLVAITFTNKAAAEMKERILFCLKEIAFQTEDGQRLAEETGLGQREAESWLKIIIEYYSDFQIRTIDSLIFAILRAVSFELGLRPDLEAEFEEKELLGRAFDQLLLELGAGDSALEGLFRKVLETFLELESQGGFNPEGKIRRRLLELFRHDILKRVRSGTGPLDLEGLKRELILSGRRLVGEVREKGASFKNPRYRWEDKFCEPTEDPGATPFHKEGLAQVIKAPTEVISELEPLYQTFKEALDRYLLARAVNRVVPYARLYDYLRQRLESLCQAEGLIYSGGWLRLVGGFLSQDTVPQIYCKLGNRLRYFLIDEFQDTSRAQWQVLEPIVVNCLAEGGALVYVGDTKQAIYVWRGAEPELFHEVPQRLPASTFEVHLPYNWRSSREIIDFNNRLFEPLAEDGLAEWVAHGFLYGQKAKRESDPFVCELAQKIKANFKEALQEPSPSATSGGRVHVYCLESEDGGLGLLRDLFRGKIPSRFEEYGEAAVLVRSNDQAELVSGWLFEMGLPTVTENALRLANSRLVQTLAAFLRFLDYPLDDVALTGVLLSDLFSEKLSEEDLERIFSRRRQGSLYSRLREVKEDLYQEFFRPLLEMVGRLSTYDLLRSLIERLSILERFSKEEAFVRRFLELVHRYEEEEGGGISGFLDFWSRRGAEERLGVPEEISAVKVLTIHAAKGLEFPVVFIPFAHWDIKPERLVCLPDGRLGYASSPYPQEIRQALMATRMAQAIEALNLLYVALTRAQKELFVFVKKGRSFGTGDVLLRLLEVSGHKVVKI